MTADANAEGRSECSNPKKKRRRSKGMGCKGTASLDSGREGATRPMSDASISEPRPTSTIREPLVPARALAEHLATDVSTVWRGVSTGRLPLPVYPTSRAARWKLSEVDAWLERTRCTPAEARADRRVQRLESERGI